jgi:hypothetical protein
MMYAVDIDQPTISGCYVPLDVGLASSAEAVSFQGLPLICSKLLCNAEPNLALFDVATLVRWYARYATVTLRRWTAPGAQSRITPE